MVEKMKTSIESTIEQDTKTELAKLKKEVLKNASASKEKLSDKEKAKQIEKFIFDMNELIMNKGKWYTKKNGTELSINKLIWWDAGSEFELSLKKNGKVVMIYSYKADVFREGNPVSMQCKVDGKMMNYTSDGKKWTYDHYEPLAQAKKYMQEIKNMIK